MIFRRLSIHFRQQNWMAIAIDFVLLVLGVFLGVLAANWNNERAIQRETDGLLSQLGEEMKQYSSSLVRAERYYLVPERFAKVAELGWASHPSVSDRQFVIAAYQASQITGATSEATVTANMFGAGQMRTIKDNEVRRRLGGVIGYDVAPMTLAAVSTPYRQGVRRIIPIEIQSALRTECGDRTPPGAETPELPDTCDIAIPPAVAADAARALRARPELLEELRWHQAAVANQIYNMREFRSRMLHFVEVVPGR